MFRFIVNTLAVLCAAFGLLLLLNAKYRTRKQLWLPLYSIGIAGVCIGETLESPYHYVLFIAGVLIASAGLLVSRVPKPE